MEGEAKPYKAWYQGEGGRIFHLGYYPCAEAAALAYAFKAREMETDQSGHEPSEHAPPSGGGHKRPMKSVDGVAAVAAPPPKMPRPAAGKAGTAVLHLAPHPKQLSHVLSPPSNKHSGCLV